VVDQRLLVGERYGAVAEMGVVAHAPTIARALFGRYITRATRLTMPELPEVETVRRGLQPVMEGARVVRVEQRRPDLRFPFPKNFNKRLEGASVEGLNRRAKYLL